MQVIILTFDLLNSHIRQFLDDKGYYFYISINVGHNTYFRYNFFFKTGALPLAQTSKGGHLLSALTEVRNG